MQTLISFPPVMFALVFVGFSAVACVIGTLWSKTATYADHLRYKAAKRAALQPIIED